MKKKRKILGIFKKCYFFAHFPKTGMTAQVAKACYPGLRLSEMQAQPGYAHLCQDAGLEHTFFAMESVDCTEGSAQCAESGSAISNAISDMRMPV